MQRAFINSGMAVHSYGTCNEFSTMTFSLADCENPSAAFSTDAVGKLHRNDYLGPNKTIALVRNGSNYSN